MLHVFRCTPFFILLLVVNVLSIYYINDTSSYGKLKYQSLIKPTITMMKCLRQDAEFTVLLAGQYDEFLRRAFFNYIPVALIAESSRLNALDKFTLTKHFFTAYQSYNFVQFLRKTRRFVLIASSQPMLRSILQRTKDSPWANPDGFYILIDRWTEQRGCTNASVYLWTAWNYDLLSVVFLCIHPSDGIVYYTFNPYSSAMPVNWRKVGHAKGRDGHPWTLFRRKFVKDRKLCRDLHFDKTNDINKYRIRLNAVEMLPYVHINSHGTSLNHYAGESSEILKIIFEKLNSNPQIYVHRNTTAYEIGGIGPNGTFWGMLSALSDGNIDMSLNPIPMFIFWKLRYTYPHIRTGLCAMSQPYEVSMFTRIRMFMSLTLLMGILAISVIAFAVFSRREGYAKAGLQVLRIMVGVGILHPPKINSARIFLCTMFILFLNVNAFFQSHWSSLLTIPIFYSNTDSSDSIKNAGYTMYGSPMLNGFLYDPVLETHFQPVTYDACIEFAKNSSKAVCVEDCFHVDYRVLDKHLYKSKMLREVTQAFVTRQDWPLHKRVNQILRQMGELGLIQRSQANSVFNYKLKSQRIASRGKSYKPLSMRQMNFTIFILAGGYACSIIVFVAELVVRRRDARPEKRQREKEARITIANNKIPDAMRAGYFF